MKLVLNVDVDRLPTKVSRLDILQQAGDCPVNFYSSTKIGELLPDVMLEEEIPTLLYKTYRDIRRAS